MDFDQRVKMAVYAMKLALKPFNAEPEAVRQRAYSAIFEALGHHLNGGPPLTVQGPDLVKEVTEA